ncbi:MAG: hypothetical protein JWN86_1227 [Planctomycetota bacterium]|nr:hypothetical protein [Planctomycetota bacterium]
MSTPLDILIDNPILVKHIRSRLRLAQLIPGLVAVLSICLVFSWATYASGSSGSWAVYVLSGIAWAILVLGGSNQVASAVGSAKESGILDFHRVSPVPASTLAVGFFLGAPIREYILFALMLPFLVLCGLVNGFGLMDVLFLVAPTILTAWVLHSLTMLVALIAKNARSASVGIIALLLISLWIGNAVYGSYRGSRMIASGTETDPGGMDFFGIRLPTIAFLFIYEGAATLFLLIAATRKMRAERALPYSKPEALICMTTVALLGLGAFWEVKETYWVVPTLLYIFVIAGCVLSSTVQPDLNEYAKGIRRALRAGRRRPPVFSELASNAWAVYGLAGLVALGASIASEVLEPGQAMGLPMSGNRFGRFAFSQSIAVGAFVVAYYGLGKQYFALKFNRKGETYFRLFLFLIWVLPLLVGVAFGVASFGAKSTQISMGVSPWAGMILSIKGLPSTDADAADIVRFMALLPSLTLAFVFQFLLINEQRRIDIALRKAVKPQTTDLDVLT